MDVRYYVDEMHVIKNIYESLIGMLLNIQKKDVVNARKYIITMKI
jgi:hypothetical protein